MGAKLAKPQPTSDNQAKVNSDIAMEAMQLIAENFLADIRSGTVSSKSLGYRLTDQRLTDQEVKMFVRTEDNVVKDDVSKAIDGIFSGDWQTVTKIAVNEIVGFVSGAVPANVAVNETWSKAFLVWEYNSLVQYSLYIRKTNAMSLGTTLKDTELTLLSVICRGLVDYEYIDPQVLVFELSRTHSDMNADQFTALLDEVEKEMNKAAKLTAVKRQLVAIPSLPLSS